MARPSRRRFVQLGGTLTIAGLAGCAGDSDDDGESDNNTDDEQLDGENESDQNGEDAADEDNGDAGGNETDDEEDTEENGDTEDDGDEDESETEDDGQADFGEPYDVRDVHQHGHLFFYVDDEQIPLAGMEENWNESVPSEQKNDYVHLHDDGSDTRWHLHARGVTVAFLLNSVPTIEYDGTELTYDGTTYSEDQITIEINGEETDPTEHELSQGDRFHVYVASDSSASFGTSIASAFGF
ncbi:hypothetical protein ACNS7O_18815 (plasmid) [Haloferacaceae archaeon DSL9]